MKSATTATTSKVDGNEVTAIAREAQEQAQRYRKKRLALGVSMALCTAYAPVALAQSANESNAAESTIEEIVVSGLRRSLTDSIAAKRFNSSVVEAISAEEMGKLPDVSIAESLGRLPGLTVARLNGRGQVVNIRGMSPDFATGLLNGREQVSVGDNRGVEFDQYPSELLSQVVVYKTPDASLIGQGLSGSVDLRTARPLEYGERMLTVNALYEVPEYDLASTIENSGHRYSATYIDQFADDTVGIVLGVASITSPNYGKNNNAWGYYNRDAAGNIAVGGGRVWARAAELERDSLVAALDFQPNDRLSIELDAFLSEFVESQVKHGLVMSTGGPIQTISAADGIVTEGVINGTIATENNLFLRDADSDSYGLNIEYALNDGWTVRADISHSSVSRSDTSEFESNGALLDADGNVVSDTIGFRTSSEGTRWSVQNDYSNVNYGGAAPAVYLTSPFGWGDPNALAPFQPAGQFGYNKVFDVDDDIDALRLEAERSLELGIFDTLRFGFNRTDRSKSRVSNEGVITSGVREGGALAKAVQVPQGLAGAADMSFGMFGANTSIIAYDPYAVQAVGAIQQGEYLYDDIFAKAWEVNEEVDTFYAKLDIDSAVFNIPLTGNIGLAWQSWDQSSSGVDASGAGAGLVTYPASDADEDDEWLPSMNLNFAVTDNQIIRFALSRNLARPRMDEMKATAFFRVNGGKAAQFNQAIINQAISVAGELQAYDELSPWTREGGNTSLKPWVSDNVDVSWEYYFPEDPSSYLAAAWFYKDLKTYIYNQKTLFDFTGFPNNSGVATDVTIGVTNSPANGEGGSIDGYELAGSLGLGMLADPLDGFGIIANYTKNSSNIAPNGPGSDSPLPGLSENIYSLTGFYEKFGFSARINYRYRDGYVGEVAGFGGARTGQDVDEEAIMDAQFGYEFQSGTLQGLKIILQVLNLTDERQQSLDVVTGLPVEYQTFGTTWLLGLYHRFF